MLRRVGIAQREVGLEHVEPRRRPVPLRVVPWGHQLDDLFQITMRPQISRDAHQHVRPIATFRQELLVDRQRARQILFAQLLSRRRQPRQRRARRNLGRCGLGPIARRRLHGCLRRRRLDGHSRPVTLFTEKTL